MIHSPPTESYKLKFRSEISSIAAEEQCLQRKMDQSSVSPPFFYSYIKSEGFIALWERNFKASVLWTDTNTPQLTFWRPTSLSVVMVWSINIALWRQMARRYWRGVSMPLHWSVIPAAPPSSRCLFFTLNYDQSCAIQLPYLFIIDQSAFYFVNKSVNLVCQS